MEDEILAADGSDLSGGSTTYYSSDYDTGNEDSGNNVLMGSASSGDSYSLLLADDFNISDNVYVGMGVCGGGCLVAIGIIVLLDILRRG